MVSIAKIEEDFPLVKDHCYLNTHAIGLKPKYVTKAVLDFQREELLDYEPGSSPPPPFSDLYEARQRVVRETRELFARLLKCDPGEVSFQENASRGANIAAHMLKLGRKDNVVSDDLNFPSMVWPWVRNPGNGPEVRIIRSHKGRVTLSDYEKAISDDTKLVTVSSVSFVNGFKADIEGLGKLAKEKNAYFLVDASLSTGYEDIDVGRWKADFVVTCNYKWLMATFGTAEFYCSRKNLEEFESPDAGYFSHEEFVFPKPVGSHPLENRLKNYRPSPTARRFELGNPCYVSIYTLKKSLEYMFTEGLDRIRRRAYRTMDELVDGLVDHGVQIFSPLDPSERSLEVFFSIKGIEASDIMSSFRSDGISAGTSKWDLTGTPGVRASVHFYNLPSNIEVFLRTVSKLNKGR